MDTEGMTPKQIETVGMLSSTIEDIEVALDSDSSEFPNEFFFMGQGSDGPCSGWIRPNGTVDWLVEA